MSLDNRTSALRALQERGLLTGEQLQQAVDHPRLAELDDNASPVATLEWLLRTHIVDAPGLLDTTSGYRTSLDGGPSGTRRALVIDTLREINQDSVDALLAEALIAADVHQVISDSLMVDRALLTPAATMALVMEAQMLPWDEYNALQARPASQRSAAANAILAETALLIDARHRTIKREFWGQVFPGPRWAYILGAPLLVGAVLWYTLADSALPGCTSEDARKAIQGSILRSFVTDRAMLGAEYPSIRNLRDVGYNKVNDIHGCMADMTIDKESEPFAYVITRDPKQPQNGFVLRGAEPDIVTARFGKLDAKGDFLHQAAPIGRTSLGQAFHAGTAALGDDPANRRVAALMRSMAGKPASAKEDKPVRPNDVEPLGACRAVTPGASYTCPLLVEWDDPMMAMLGRGGSQLLRGDFTFEPNAAGTVPAWRVSADFAGEVQRARLGAVAEKPAHEGADK